MGRILFFVILALAIYLAWRWMKIQRIRDAAAGAHRRPADGEAMVRCGHCGLNLPKSEALAAHGADGQRWYCCEEHRRQGSAAG